jgi:sulfopyruvate decarboxylase subunit beta
MMPRTQAVEILARHRGDAIIVAVYHAAYDWMRLSQSPLNFYANGAMGQASSHALAFAIGVPERKVMVFDGDGSLLMNLGSLVTIANQAPKNFIHFVFENGIYEANGGQPIPTAKQFSFATLARGAGYREVFEFDEIERFAAAAPHLMTLEGPVFVTMKVAPGEKSPLDKAYYAFVNGPETRRDFKAGIAEIIAART